MWLSVTAINNNHNHNVDWCIIPGKAARFLVDTQTNTHTQCYEYIYTLPHTYTHTHTPTYITTHMQPGLINLTFCWIFYMAWHCITAGMSPHRGCACKTPPSALVCTAWLWMELLYWVHPCKSCPPAEYASMLRNNSKGTIKCISCDPHLEYGAHALGLLSIENKLITPGSN